MRFQSTIHHYPSMLRLPEWVFLTLLWLPRWLVPIHWTTYGGSESCPFGRVHIWPKDTPVVYAMCPRCSKEWLWKGGAYQCGSCGFSTTELFLKRAQLFRGLIFLGTFVTWREGDGWSGMSRVRGDYSKPTERLIVDTVWEPIKQAAGEPF